jgi:hypothetical protein
VDVGELAATIAECCSMGALSSSVSAREPSGATWVGRSTTMGSENACSARRSISRQSGGN